MMENRKQKYQKLSLEMTAFRTNIVIIFTLIGLYVTFL